MVKADDVVVKRFLEFLLPGDQAGQVGEPLLATGLDLREVSGRHDAFLDQRFAGQQFDLQPSLKLVFVRPDGPHVRARIPLNHEPTVGKRRGIVEEVRAPSGAWTLRVRSVPGCLDHCFFERLVRRHGRCEPGRGCAPNLRARRRCQVICAMTHRALKTAMTSSARRRAGFLAQAGKWK